MKTIVILLGTLLFLLSETTQAGSLKHNFSIAKGDPSTATFKLARKSQAKLTYQWMSLRDVPDSIRATFAEDANYNPESVVLLARSQFLLSRPLEKFSGDYFLNPKLLETMSGMKHKATDVDNLFTVKYQPAPWVTIRSIGEVTFPSSLPAEGLFLNQKDAEVVVDLSFYDFSAYIHQVNTLWSFSEFQGYSRVEMLSLAVLRWTQMKGLKKRIAKDAIEDNLKIQIKETVKVLEK